MLAAALAAALLLAPAGAAFADEGAGPSDITVVVPTAGPDDAGGRAIANAQLRWGLNAESGAGAFAGGCNFLSAGRAGDSGGVRVWTAADGFYRASEGDVRIERPDAAGEWRLASFEHRCLDASGAALSAASLTSNSGNQVVIDGGVGSYEPGRGLRVAWTGSFTVAFYGGMTYWSATDPVLTLDGAGDGRLTASASGFATSMEDLSKWEPIPPRTIVLAELRGVRLDGDSFAVVPEYLGVASPESGQIARTSENAPWWGAFPASFMAFQRSTGQTGYWVTTGGQRDRAKPATTMWVSYDAATAAVPPAPAGAGGGAAPIQNALRLRPPSAVVTGAVPAAQPPAAAAASGGGSVPTVFREGLALVPSAAGAGDGALPILGAVLAALVAALCGLHLAGVPIAPWRRAAGGGEPHA